jgi:hypothetical protein
MRVITTCDACNREVWNRIVRGDVDGRDLLVLEIKVDHCDRCSQRLRDESYAEGMAAGEREADDAQER